MEEAIDDLANDEQLLIHLYYYEDRPLRDIAYIMDVEPNALATRLHRIRKKLSRMIKQKEHGQADR
jgi:RNA polymerase sigma-70 factor (ECF subfamily)